MPEDRFRVLATFPLKLDDLFIVSFPKSGTTWTQQIVRLLRNNGTQDTSGVHIGTAIPNIDMPINDQTIKVGLLLYYNEVVGLLVGKLSTAKYIQG